MRKVRGKGEMIERETGAVGLAVMFTEISGNHGFLRQEMETVENVDRELREDVM